MTNEFNPDWMCVCGDLTALGVVHRKDGPCYYPDKREWVGIEQSDMPSGENPMFDHEFFIAGMVFAAKVLERKNT